MAGHISSAFCAEIKTSPISKLPDESENSLSWRDALKEGDKRLKLQQLDLAEGCYRQAVREVQKDPGSSADHRALCLEKLGQLLQMLDITEEAIPQYKKALKILEKAHGKVSPLLLPDLLALGGICENEGDYKVAEQLYDRAAKIAQIGNLGNSYKTAQVDQKLGHLNAKLARTSQAELYYRSALAVLLKQTVLPSSDLLESVISDYSDLLEKNYAKAKNLPFAVTAELLKDRLVSLQQKRGVAASAFERAVSGRMAQSALEKIPAEELASKQDKTLADKVQTENMALPATPESISGSISGSTPSFSTIGLTDPIAAEAINKQRVAFYERMVAVDIKSLGPDHPSVGRDLTGLSAVYMAVGQYDQAKTLLMRALQINEKVYGSDSAMTQRTRAMLELVSENEQASQSGTDQSIYLATDLPKLPLAAQKIDIAIRLNYLAALCYSLGKVADAEKLYAWAVADIYYSCGDQNLLLAAGLDDYARTLRSGGDTNRAGRIEAEARAIKRRVVSRQLIKSVQ